MPLNTEEACSFIRAAHRRRVFAMETRKRMDNALGAFLRTQLGWVKDGPDNEAVKSRVNALIAAGEMITAAKIAAADGKASRKKPVEVPAEYSDWADIIEAAIRGRAPFDEIEKAALKGMTEAARALPVWRRFADVNGVGAAGVATIIGEAGDLSIYSNESKLWKRMGVAVMGPGDGLHDHRQGAPGPNATAQDWIAEGYSKARRSRLFTIGDALIKAQGPYRDIYLRRKAYEVAKAEARGLTIAPSAKIPAKRREEFMAEGAIHRRAQRYMEKRLLRHMWRAWRGTGQSTTAPDGAKRLAPALSQQTAGRARA
jgi:hypothetical protein